MNFAFYISGSAGRLRKVMSAGEEYLAYTKIIISDSIQNNDFEDMLHTQWDIKYILIDYEMLKKDKNQALSDEILSVLVKYKIDYCFSFGNHLLKGELLKRYENKIINFHPSILPSFRGRNAIDQAIKENAFLLGCTAHFIDSGIDTGPVIMQSVMHKRLFGENDYDRILDTQLIMLRKIIDLLIHQRITVIDKNVIIDGADYAKIELFPYI